MIVIRSKRSVEKTGCDRGNYSPDSALFEVKNKDGQIVFAVYNDGVRIYVDDVGQRAQKEVLLLVDLAVQKVHHRIYLVVTPDTIRMYINDTGDKGKGGFAIGGFGTSKGASTQNLIIVSNDSIRMYIDDMPTNNERWVCHRRIWYR